MAAALNMKWTSACGTNRGLTEDNLYYLATKAFRQCVAKTGRDFSATFLNKDNQ